MWICHSQQELRAEELCQALAVEIGSTDYNADDAPSIQTVLNCCQGLVVVDEGSTVRLIHRSLLGYLVSHRSFFRSPHSTIAEACLSYLNSKQVMALSGSSAQGTEHPLFLEYSSLCWGTHLRKGFSDGGKALALKLFSSYERHISIRPLLEKVLGLDSVRSIVNFYKFTGLHFASIFGLVEVAMALIKMDGVDINRVDETGYTPLLWAAKYGYEGVAKLLLEREEINPDGPDNDLRAPISWASGNGREAVVKRLLARGDVNPDRLDMWNRTPISWAARNGHEAIVKLLLGREDVSPDRPDIYGQAPISLAAKNGNGEVVKLFLGRKGVNPDRPDKGGRKPKSWAAENRHEVVAQLFDAKRRQP